MESTKLEFCIRSGNEQDVLQQIRDAGLIESFKSDTLHLMPSEAIDILICLDGVVLVFMYAYVNDKDQIALPFQTNRKVIDLNVDSNMFLELLEEKLDALRRAANKPTVLA